MVFGVMFNLASTCIYFIWLNEKQHGTVDILLEPLHKALWWGAIVLFLVSAPLFIATVMLKPGYIKPLYDFTKLIEVAFDIGLHLDNFCSYCEVIKSETSFHCTICNRCVELFDHHCPFINNCLGYRNHKYFLMFIVTFSIYLGILMSETLRHFAEIYQVIGFECFYTDSMCTVNMILIFMHLPIMGFQIYSQFGGLLKKPTLQPSYIQMTDYQNTLGSSDCMDATIR